MNNEKAAKVADDGPELMEDGGIPQRKSQGDIEKARKSTKAKASTIKKGVDGPELMESPTTPERKHRALVGKSKSPTRSPRSDYNAKLIRYDRQKIAYAPASPQVDVESNLSLAKAPEQANSRDKVKSEGEEFYESDEETPGAFSVQGSGGPSSVTRNNRPPLTSHESEDKKREESQILLEATLVEEGENGREKPNDAPVFEATLMPEDVGRDNSKRTRNLLILAFALVVVSITVAVATVMASRSPAPASLISPDPLPPDPLPPDSPTSAISYSPTSSPSPTQQACTVSNPDTYLGAGECRQESGGYPLSFAKISPDESWCREKCCETDWCFAVEYTASQSECQLVTDLETFEASGQTLASPTWGGQQMIDDDLWTIYCNGGQPCTEGSTEFGVGSLNTRFGYQCWTSDNLVIPEAQCTDTSPDVYLGAGECRQESGGYPLTFSKAWSNENWCREKCCETDWCLAAEFTTSQSECHLVTDVATFQAAGQTLDNRQWGGEQIIDGDVWTIYCNGGGECTEGSTDFGVGSLNARSGYQCWIAAAI
jgi:hypothetical protein